MNKKQIESAFAPIAALLFQIRESDNKVVDIIDEIKKQLKALYEAGADVKTVKEYLVFWNTNTEDSKPIRSNDAINKWLRDAGWRQREAVRSDKDTVKSDKDAAKETREQALARIKTLMAQHGITAKDLA
jgi:hypothetical protein